MQTSRNHLVIRSLLADSLADLVHDPTEIHNHMERCVVVTEAFFGILTASAAAFKTDSGDHSYDECRVEVYLSHLHLPCLHTSHTHTHTFPHTPHTAPVSLKSPEFLSGRIVYPTRIKFLGYFIRTRDIFSLGEKGYYIFALIGPCFSYM